LHSLFASNVAIDANESKHSEKGIVNWNSNP